MTQWKCSVCGYEHKGESAPEKCPRCGSPQEKFRLLEEVVEQQEGGEEGAEKAESEEEQTWKCSICGHVHKGDSPPEQCAVCKVDSEKFVPHSTDAVGKTEAVGSGWKCSVCGHVHKGGEAPDACPLCGVGRDKFTKHSQATSPSESTESSVQDPQAAKSPQSFLVKFVQKYHLHPIHVHFPNGILPASVLFMMLAVLTPSGYGLAFDIAAYFNLIFVLLCMPLVIFTGYIEWTSRYLSASTTLFKIKISSSILMTFLLVLLVLWRSLDSQVLLRADSGSHLYLLMGAIMVGLAGITGHLGGHLVFSSRA